MKVLIINGSPRVNGNTSVAVREMEKVFAEEGVETEVVQVGNKDIRGCIACGYCRESGKCVFNDVVNELAPKFEEADGLVVASPVYYASANATLIACLTRLFYSTPFDKSMKVGASVVCARRGGCSATFDELNKFFTISNMPIASSQYWNSIHGREQGQAEMDEEGRQTMRVLARNMSFLMKSIALGKEKYGLPEKEEHLWTHFIR
ncbi:Cd1 [uncultured Ruminococcus sp.]|uniref:flavodoxin family protein n=1 Tax=Huintestinicola butyrica TaxID=2981728 RepID=UPI0008234C32|nr:flavodoxin family protein [Huintestinicola butyrica]MCU6728966.1 flavodoxin family protein [Huintestinicola butyrica]SCJ31009.1 Cd1 [uncultured Ruminococcus sp.]